MSMYEEGGGLPTLEGFCWFLFGLAVIIVSARVACFAGVEVEVMLLVLVFALDLGLELGAAAVDGTAAAPSASDGDEV